MATRKNTNAVALTWNECDPSTLSPELAKAYQAYKSAYAIAKGLRSKFEEAANTAAELPATKALVFSYNFGKLNIAIGEPSKAKGVGSKAVSFMTLKDQLD